MNSPLHLQLALVLGSRRPEPFSHGLFSTSRVGADRAQGRRGRALVHPPRLRLDRYPAIAATAAKLKARSFTLDGEAVVTGADGIAVFYALHRCGRVTDAILQTFDLLELDGEDLRTLPFGQRKPRLVRLLTRAQAGIALNDHTDAKGELVFRQACVMGLEGILSKRLSAPYRSGLSRDWIKVKNPDSPAMVRHREGRW
jgi:bifunctional non-homologous end joining protein LigD